jgi:hypothetical protein
VDASQWMTVANRRRVRPGWRSAPGPVWMSPPSRRSIFGVEETNSHDRRVRPAASMIVQVAAIERMGGCGGRRAGGCEGGRWVVNDGGEWGSTVALEGWLKCVKGRAGGRGKIEFC